jgi:molybdate transport system substrate-binding protein
LGTSVTEVLSWVSSGNAEAGVVYETDAARDNRVKIVGAAPPGSHSDIVYPAAVIKGSIAEKQAKAYLDFLGTAKAAQVFKKYGFSVID